jgi:uncharacterized protein YjbJ (UPF0337 family)
MQKERLAGIRLQLAGRINEIWGEWTGDSLRSADGRRDQAVGKAQQAGVIEQEQATRQLAEFRHDHRNWFF